MRFWWVVILVLSDLIILTIFKTATVSLYLDKSIYSQIPIIYWIELSSLLLVLYIASRFADKPWQALVLLLLFYFAIYTLNLFFVTPYGQTDRSIFRFAEILRNTNYIGKNEISLEVYFEWPIFFSFLKMLDLILGTTMNYLITIGFFIFHILLPLFIIFFINERNDLNVLFLAPIIYIIISYYFIVYQFAPQTMGLLYIILIFGLYYRLGLNLRFRFLLLLFYSVLVFTHPFTFLFFLGGVIIDGMYIYFSKKANVITDHFNLILLLVVIYGLGSLYIFNISSDIKQSLYEIKFGIGETIGVAYNAMGNSAVHLGGHALYRFVPEVYAKTFSSLARLVLVLFVIIFLVGFVIKRKKIDVKIADISIVTFNAILFAIGLFTTFLGQRSLQIITMPISRIYGQLIKQSKAVSQAVGILIVIAPTLFIINSCINNSIDGGVFIDDEEMDYAGHFVDWSAVRDQTVFSFSNSYPTGYPEQIKVFESDEYLKKYLNQMDIVINSPKIKLRSEFFGFPNEENIQIMSPNQIYDNGYTSLIFNYREKQ